MNVELYEKLAEIGKTQSEIKQRLNAKEIDRYELTIKYCKLCIEKRILKDNAKRIQNA